MAYQGELDGLCGPYAVVNAYDRCGLNEEWLGKDLFNISCLAIKGWPNILWKGTNFDQMQQMVNSCQKALTKAYKEAGEEFPVRVEYPFSGGRRPKSNWEYWLRFDDLFSCNDVVCGILGMEHPHQHWIAFQNKRRALSMFDSDAMGKRWRIRKKDIHAGQRCRKKFRVNRKELLVFRHVGPE